MPRKTLFLHVGMPKTATSLIQSVLAINIDRLSCEYQIIYPSEYPHHSVALGGGITSGNGVLLDDALRRDSVDDDIVDLFVESDRSLLFSSERLFSTLSQSTYFSRLTTGLFNKYDHVSVLLLVRNPLDHIISAYIQNVKRGGYTEHIDNFIKQHDYTFVKLIKCLHNNFCQYYPKCSVTLANYSIHHNNILDVVEKWLDCSLQYSADNLPVINRSLNAVEVAIQTGVNITANKLGRNFADKVTALKVPNSKAIRPSLLEQNNFFQRIRSDVDDVNKILPESESLVLTTIPDENIDHNMTQNLRAIGEIVGLYLDDLETTRKLNKALKASVLFQKGLVEYTDGNFEKAVKFFENTLKINRNHVMAGRMLKKIANAK